MLPACAACSLPGTLPFCRRSLASWVRVLIILFFSSSCSPFTGSLVPLTLESRLPIDFETLRVLSLQHVVLWVDRAINICSDVCAYEMLWMCVNCFRQPFRLATRLLLLSVCDDFGPFKVEPQRSTPGYSNPTLSREHNGASCEDIANDITNLQFHTTAPRSRTIWRAPPWRRKPSERS